MVEERSLNENMELEPGKEKPKKLLGKFFQKKQEETTKNKDDSFKKPVVEQKKVEPEQQTVQSEPQVTKETIGQLAFQYLTITDLCNIIVLKTSQLEQENVQLSDYLKKNVLKGE